MVFSSLFFLIIFFPIVFGIYYLVPYKWKNIILLLSSLIFYAWGEPIYVFLMLATCFVGFKTAPLMQKYSKHKKVIFISTIVFYLAILGFFKYANFLIENINYLFNFNINALNLSLPIGISFYTFQIMSYTIDVYNNKIKVEKSFLDFTTYVALFPQLIAGPIVRYETINQELHNRKITLDNFTQGIFRFAIGLGKKVLLANNIGMLYTTITSSHEVTTISSWLAIIAYSFQIYFDFSGYSDMAIGMGKMLGFTFLENFNYPYTATSITAFWQRWHISLSSFFKDYVYIPLGGNRCKMSKHIRNILIVWGLTGLWHGASWNFVIWGLYFGVLLIIEKYWLKKYIEKLPKIFRILYTDILVLFSWAIFSFENITSLMSWLKNMFGVNIHFMSNETLYIIKNYIVLLLICCVASTPIAKTLKEKISKLQNPKYLNLLEIAKTLFVICIFVLSLAYLVNASYNPFLYFRF